MGDSSPALLQNAMQGMEDELQALLNDWAGAEDNLIRRTSQVERLKAPKRFELKTSPPHPKLTKEDLDALVLDWLWTEHAELMAEQLNAEACCAAYRIKEKVAGRALSSMQTRLNADIKLNAVPRGGQ